MSAAAPAAQGIDTVERTDTVLLAGFEAASFAPGTFRHADHVRLAWLLHRRHSPIEALTRLDGGLRRLAAAGGAPDHYHETVTWAWSAIVRERMERHPADSWPAFAAANPDLLDPSVSILGRYYRQETLASELARRVFVLPGA